MNDILSWGFGFFLKIQEYAAEADFELYKVGILQSFYGSRADSKALNRELKRNVKKEKPKTGVDLEEAMAWLNR